MEKTSYEIWLLGENDQMMSNDFEVFLKQFKSEEKAQKYFDEVVRKKNKYAFLYKNKTDKCRVTLEVVVDDENIGGMTCIDCINVEYLW